LWGASPGFIAETPFFAWLVMNIVTTYAILFIAIAFEVVGTSALLASQQFTRPGPTAVVVGCYAVALALMSITFRTIPMGIVYAIWSGAGMVMIVAVGWVGFGQRLDQPALVGVGLILAGVTVLNLFSRSLVP
jgi:small multidrug resistance pump